MKCAQKMLDRADIVREGILRQSPGPRLPISQLQTSRPSVRLPVLHHQQWERAYRRSVVNGSLLGRELEFVSQPPKFWTIPDSIIDGRDHQRP